MRMQDIFDYQVKSLVGMVQRLQQSGGADRGLEARVRTFVAGELLGRGNADVIARAMGELEYAEADLLNDMVNHCTQTFYRTDAVWSAFAVPVAVNWHMRQHRIYKVNRGDKEYIDALASGIRQCTGSKAVILDTHIYSATELFRAEARTLHDHLQTLVIGAPRTTAPLKFMSLRSSSEPPWRVAYFLGVEVLEGNAKRRLNEPGVQEAMQSYLHLGADALTMPKSVMFNHGATGNTVCHSPLYLTDAIRSGQKALRGYRLRQILEEIAKAEKRVTLYYTFNPLAYSLDILLSGKWLAFEMRWKLFRDEAMDEFLQYLDVAISAGAQNIDCTLVCLEFDEFEAARAATAVDCYRRKKR
jgi:hypothetical protein